MWNQIVITFLIFVIIVDGVEETSAKEKTVDEFIDDLIHRNPVMVFSKTYCRYSKRAKRLLFEKYNIHPKHVLELDEREDMNEIQDYLSKLSGVHTVPQVFVRGEFIGGATDLEKLDKKGRLVRILQKAKVL